MWLLNTTTLHLKEFSGSTKPAYAILSHTWFESEVLFHEIHNDPVDEKIKARPGFSKIRRFCELAKSRGFDYGWVDSCCIDKRSSAELSEAIGSMFAWYRDADICIVYLEDVPAPVKLNDFKNARWFTRGWTLQELIASENRSFFAKDWSEIVDWYFGPYGELDMLTLVAKITGVKASVLRDSHKLWACCIAERMSWASSRQTTRPEDRAYSLMGLFDINISIQYGEGLQKAFARLQKEILRTSFDDSIFVWHSQDTSSGLLAQSPDDFTGLLVLI
ncbi:heterokaryon incompatibility protein-domain-containing protein [Dendryphion nanum]|uniref:Heterokaryon incompatibility protein-domain-containing protein n=1 Tax=Dendryphion nanum TaxID=256645 RepID=A0A9P9D817_9PLEO|nr:heterokaryon incompatibility protein-domain-containing protein [Dendryphion nanum]